MIWVVYIILCHDGTLYTGISNNLEKRLEQHTNGQGAKYTKGRGPFKLIYKEKCADRARSSKREIEIKKLSREKKLSLAGVS